MWIFNVEKIILALTHLTEENIFFFRRKLLKSETMKILEENSSEYLPNFGETGHPPPPTNH